MPGPVLGNDLGSNSMGMLWSQNLHSGNIACFATVAKGNIPFHKQQVGSASNPRKNCFLYQILYSMIASLFAGCITCSGVLLYWSGEVNRTHLSIASYISGQEAKPETKVC